MGDVVGISGEKRSEETPLRDESIQRGLFEFQTLNEQGRLQSLFFIAVTPDGATLSTLRGETLPSATMLLGSVEIAKERLMQGVRAKMSPMLPVLPE